MQLNFVARFYNENFVPKQLTAPAQVLYEIEIEPFSGANYFINGSVIAPANVSTYSFDVTLPADTLTATGYLLKGNFLTFSCGCGGNN